MLLKYGDIQLKNKEITYITLKSWFDEIFQWESIFHPFWQKFRESNVFKMKKLQVEIWFDEIFQWERISRTFWQKFREST